MAHSTTTTSVPTQRRGLGLISLLIAAAAVLSPVQEERAEAATPPCGTLADGYDPARPPRYEHVVVLMEENVTYGQFQASSQMPYLKKLSRLCGSATNFHAATHPSMPNYMAATSGIASPLGKRVDNDNIFKQLERRGRTWKSYQESMPAPCSSAYTGFYKTGHNPAFFYDNLRTPVTRARGTTSPCALLWIAPSPRMRCPPTRGSRRTSATFSTGSATAPPRARTPGEKAIDGSRDFCHGSSRCPATRRARP